MTVVPSFGAKTFPGLVSLKLPFADRRLDAREFMSNCWRDGQAVCFNSSGQDTCHGWTLSQNQFEHQVLGRSAPPSEYGFQNGWADPDKRDSLLAADRLCPFGTSSEAGCRAAFLERKVGLPTHRCGSKD